MKKTLKAIDRAIELAYQRLGQGVQIDVMNICHIFAAGREALIDGRDLDTALKEAIAVYREN